MEKIIGSLSTPKISGSLSGSGTISATLGVPVYAEYETYEGETEVTPSDEAQVLLTSGLLMVDNITINPIPSNYGRIEWNGSIITVS